MDIKRICFYGGPGSGKSTIASGVFHTLKMDGLNIEYVPEYIKNWAYEGRTPKSFQQLYVFAKQLNQEDTLFPHVDVITTDSPLLMNSVYSEMYGFSGWDLLREMAMLYEKHFPGLHIFLKRDGIPYQTEGRYQNYEEALEVDHKITQVLSDNVDYVEFLSSDFEGIIDYIKSNLQ